MNGPWRITFDTNPDDCNLRCVMCEEHSILLKQRKFEASGRRRRMDPKRIPEIIAECAPHGLREVIPSTMGEPLMYEGFNDIVEAATEHGVKINLTTNGTFPRLGAEAWARILVPVCSDIKISWNGSTAATHERIMIGTKFDAQVKRLETLLRVRDEARARGEPACSVTLQCTFLEDNIEDLPSLVEMAIRLGIDRVKGHHLWVHLDAMKGQDMRRDASASGRWNQVAAECHAIADARPLPNGERISLANFDPIDSLESRERTGDCPFLGKEAWVNSEGRFDPCCAPDYLRQRLGNFGDTQRGLMYAWQSAAYAHLVENYKVNEVCKTCVMRAP